jgi:enoyl-CoA hydratase/carnithine racemase
MEIVVSVEAGILQICFAREHKKNALTNNMYQGAAEALRQAQDDATVRAIVITGGHQVFTAGNDLEDFLNNPPIDEQSPVLQFLAALRQNKKPLIAAVCGVAVGIGTTMLMHCDMVYAAENAMFSMPFTQLGLCPEAGVSFLLPRIAGYQFAAEKLMLGEAFSAAEAQRAGFVTRILPAAEVLPYALTQAHKIVALPAASVQLTKRLMQQNEQALLEKQMTEEAQHFARMLREPAAKEAFTAFLEKRKPDFTRY